jgi:hypothetical protein
MFPKGLTTERENICQGNFEPLSYVNFGAIDKIKQYLNGQNLGIWINSNPRDYIHELTYNSPSYSHAKVMEKLSAEMRAVSMILDKCCPSLRKKHAKATSAWNLLRELEKDVKKRTGSSGRFWTTQLTDFKIPEIMDGEDKVEEFKEIAEQAQRCGVNLDDSALKGFITSALDPVEFKYDVAELDKVETTLDEAYQKISDMAHAARTRAGVTRISRKRRVGEMSNFIEEIEEEPRRPPRKLSTARYQSFHASATNSNQDEQRSDRAPSFLRNDILKIQRLRDIPEDLFNILIQHLPENHKCKYGRGCWFVNNRGPPLIKDFKEHMKRNSKPQE